VPAQPASLGDRVEALVNGAGAAADSLRGVAQRNADGMSVHIAGPLGSAADSGEAFKGIDSTLLYATLTVVIVLLLIT
jgi:RND superfamily putative drug exporter